MADKKAAAAGASEKAAQTVETEVSLLDQIVQTASSGSAPDQKERGRDMVREFVSQVLAGEMTVSRDTEAMINGRIAQLDHLISIQLAEVMHNAEFQKLEASWRGLQYLIKNSECTPMLKIRVLNVSKRELGRDLQRAAEFDQSAIFKKVYEEEYGVFGGEPFAALLGDYEFSKSFEDLELLENMSHVAAAAHAPFLTAANANLLNLDSFTNLGAAAGSGQGLRHHGIRQVEGVPDERRFALRGNVRAAHPDARALRQGHPDDRGVQLRRRSGRHAIIPNICGATRHMRWRRG